MGKQLTIRGVCEETASGVDERRRRLERYATWTEEDRNEFEAALASQRTVDEDASERIESLDCTVLPA